MKNTIVQPARMLTVDDVAQRLSLSTKSIRRAIADGELQHYRFGGAIRVAPEDLDVCRNRSRGGPTRKS
jgi:excisionase family DNA binding protein